MSLTRKFAVVLAMVTVAGVATLALSHRPASQPAAPMSSGYTTTTLHIGTTTVVAEVADTDALRRQGLGNRTRLEDGRGMWFVFDTDGLWAFWMKDTLIPLDMIWADTAGTIVFIAHDVKPESYPQAFAPQEPARYVLEVPGGFVERHTIAKGDTIKF